MADVRGACLPAKRSRKSLGAPGDLARGVLELPLAEELSSDDDECSRVCLAGRTLASARGWACLRGEVAGFREFGATGRESRGSAERAGLGMQCQHGLGLGVQSVRAGARMQCWQCWLSE